MHLLSWLLVFLLLENESRKNRFDFDAETDRWKKQNYRSSHKIHAENLMKYFLESLVSSQKTGFDKCKIFNKVPSRMHRFARIFCPSEYSQSFDTHYSNPKRTSLPNFTSLSLLHKKFEQKGKKGPSVVTLFFGIISKNLKNYSVLDTQRQLNKRFWNLWLQSHMNLLEVKNIDHSTICFYKVKTFLSHYSPCCRGPFKT